jgi:hypothetical protein
MSLGSRIRRLERGRGPVGCPECGYGGPGPVVLRMLPPKVLRQGWTRADLEASARERPEDFCGSCGRKTVMRMPSPFLSRKRPCFDGAAPR